MGGSPGPPRRSMTWRARFASRPPLLAAPRFSLFSLLSLFSTLRSAIRSAVLALADREAREVSSVAARRGRDPQVILGALRLRVGRDAEVQRAARPRAIE